MDIAIPDYLHDLFHNLYQLQQADRHCDVSIATCENSHVPAHSLILIGSGSTMLNEILWRRSHGGHLVVEDFRHESSTVIQSFVKSLYTGHVDVTSENVESLKSLYRLTKLDKFVDVIDNFLMYNNVTKCSPVSKISEEVQENHVAHSSGGLVAVNNEEANYAIHSAVGVEQTQFQENDVVRSTVGLRSINKIKKGKRRNSNNDLHANDRKHVEDQIQSHVDENISSLQIVESKQCFKIARSPDICSSTTHEDGIQQGNVRFRAAMTSLDSDTSDEYSSPENELLGNDCQPEKHEISIVASEFSDTSEVKRERSDGDGVFLEENVLQLKAETQEEVGHMSTKRKSIEDVEIQETSNLNGKKESRRQPGRKNGYTNIPCKVRRTSYLPNHPELLMESLGSHCSDTSGEKMMSEIFENDNLFDMNREVKTEVIRQACYEIEKGVETTSLSREVEVEVCQMQKDEFTSVGRLAKVEVATTDVKENSQTLKKIERSTGDNTMELSSDNPILQAIYNKSKMLCPVWVKNKRYAKICGHCDEQETDCQCPPVPKERQHKCKSCPRTFRDHTSRTNHMMRDHALSCTHCDYSHFKIRYIANHLYMKHGLILDAKKFPVLKCEAEVRNKHFEIIAKAAS